MVEGITFDLSDRPCQSTKAHEFKFDTKLKEEMNQEIASFLKRGVIEETVHEPGEIISNIFPRRKKSGKIRIIGNFKDLNQDIVYKKFKQTTVQDVLNNIRPKSYMCSIDLSDAYYSVNVKKSDRKFLKFQWNGKLYQFCGLGQGIGCAPRIFTKLMRVPLSFLRRMGINVLAYIDDLIIISDTYEDCLKDTQACLLLLQRLGYIVNFEKSALIPSQTIDHLGLTIDSNNMSVRVTTDKCQALVQKCKSLRDMKSPSIREVASVLGLMISFIPGAEMGQLHYRQLEYCKNKALFHSCFDFSKTMSLNSGALEDISWWQENVHSQVSLLARSKPSVFIETDSSKLHWGARIVGGPHTQGSWDINEQLQHINVLELSAIKLGVQALCFNAANIHIRIKTDNSTCVAYINKKGGSKSRNLNKISVNLWQWCLARNIFISAEHIRGCNNTHADFLSRYIDNSGEWGLKRESFLAVTNFFKMYPTIDIFASRLNFQCARYMSWMPDPGSIGTDALSQYLEDEIFWAFPPFNLLSRFLQKVHLEGLEGIIIAPCWSAQSFFPQLVKLFIDFPVFLRWHPSLLVHPSGMNHPLGQHLRLMACVISGKVCKREDFQRKLCKLFIKGGAQTPSSNIRLILRNGYIFVNQEILMKIPVL